MSIIVGIIKSLHRARTACQYHGSCRRFLGACAVPYSFVALHVLYCLIHAYK